jgi:hypothetical protein
VTATITSTLEAKRQARWDERVKAYRALGLCVACADLAAYGHRVGFNRIGSPCETCLPFVNASTGERQGKGWRVMVAATVADKWLASVKARHVPPRVLAVARVVADHTDDEGLSQISRRFIERNSRAGTVLDAAKGLKSLQDSGWLVLIADADATTRTPRTFQLSTPVRALAHDHITH